MANPEHFKIRFRLAVITVHGRGLVRRKKEKRQLRGTHSKALRAKRARGK